MSGKVIVITGANGGLGRALASRFALEGERVVLLGRSLPKVEAIAAGLSGMGTAIACDVANPDSVRSAFAEIAERFDQIDVFINNAAVFQPMPIGEADDAHILDGVLTNLAGPMFCTRSAISLMARGGLIVSVSSESVELPFPYLLVYQATKAGLEKFTLGLNAELADQGIRACVVRAGQMMGEGMSGEIDPEIGARFFQAAMARGLNLLERGHTDYSSATQAVRSLIDMPADMHVDFISFHGRRPD